MRSGSRPSAPSRVMAAHSLIRGTRLGFASTTYWRLEAGLSGIRPYLLKRKKERFFRNVLKNSLIISESDFLLVEDCSMEYGLLLDVKPAVTGVSH